MRTVGHLLNSNYQKLNENEQEGQREQHLEKPNKSVDRFEDKNTKKTSLQKLSLFNKSSVQKKILNLSIPNPNKIEKEYSAIELQKRPWPSGEIKSDEEIFCEKPTVSTYFELAHDFDSALPQSRHAKFYGLDNFLLNPENRPKEDLILEDIQLREKEEDFEDWHAHNKLDFDKGLTTEKKKTIERHVKLWSQGDGVGGRMSTVVGNTKAKSYYAKNNFTLRGQIFKYGHEVHGRTIDELLPRYGSRKGFHIGVRVAQFSINGILTALGYGLAPLTFGISKIVSDHVRTVITLSGEVITHKFAGATNEKIKMHAALRGMQLEIPLFVPVAGNIVRYYEAGMLGVSAFGIVSTTLADAILSHTSTRYCSTISIDDLGNSEVLNEIKNRIDYLSRFLLPYGQYLLLNEPNLEERKKLKKKLKSQFKTLRHLEKKRTLALNFYRLALVAEKIPEPHKTKIRQDCAQALKEDRKNTHRIAKRCLKILLEKDKILLN
jgi:hypothetical protein